MISSERRGRGIWTVIVLAAFLVPSSGCAAQEVPMTMPSGSEPAETRTAPMAPPKALDFAVATFESTEPGGDAAALEGRVRVRDGCLYVQPERSRGFVLPIFPAARLRVADDGLYFNSTLLREGAWISLGGGGRDSVPSDARIPPECTDTSRVFQVANNP